MRRLFCFGLGYSARALVRGLDRETWQIAGTARDRERAAAALPGVALHRFDGGRPLADVAATFGGATHILVSIPPDPDDPVLRWHHADLQRLKALRWLGYLSATSVYGDCGGAMVDEQAPVRPSGERGRRRAEGEAAWLGLLQAHGLPVHVFRLAGIYGPGRSVLERLTAGTARHIVKPGQVFSRIHVEDIARTLAASIARPRLGAIYNVADDEPAPPQDVLAFGAALLGLPVPPEEPYRRANLGPLAASYFQDHRRIDNRLLKQELGVVLRYPNYRLGLAAMAGTFTSA